ncbi:glycosyltransferase [Gaetbulibacter aquiaggeris]|uniref:Glycosyltransferase n=1 Tax=Gaetbulibacter aquiaggeris TaxID=1735373 RepID=A0ABW7MNH5_9FLAO
MTFFSVIIPLYNKEDYIEETIKSVLNQSFNDFEIIIVDDGSTDDSLKLASQFTDSKITLIKQKNLGASVARNKAIETAKGKYIAPLDADDIWHKNHLLELKSLINSFPNAGLFCNNYEIKLNDNFVIKANFNFSYGSDHLEIPDFFDANIINYIPSSSSTAFLKSSFVKLGAYDTSLRTGQDLDLWIRFALQYKVVFNPTITMVYNNYDDSSLSKSDYNLDRYNYISNFNTEEQQNPSLKKYLDVNRYAVALRCKINNEKKLYRKLKNEIDYKNLNIKQKFLINIPAFGLKLIKRFQCFLINRKIYVTAFK